MFSNYNINMKEDTIVIKCSYIGSVWFDESDQVDSGINKISLQNTGCKLLQKCCCAKLTPACEIYH